MVLSDLFSCWLGHLRDHHCLVLQVQFILQHLKDGFVGAGGALLVHEHNVSGICLLRKDLNAEFAALGGLVLL